MPKQQNLSDVIRQANQNATLAGHAVGIAWVPTLGEWQIYSLLEDTPKSHEPELICFGQGVIPLAVTPIAMEALMCSINETLERVEKASA